MRNFSSLLIILLGLNITFLSLLLGGFSKSNSFGQGILYNESKLHGEGIYFNENGEIEHEGKWDKGKRLN